MFSPNAAYTDDSSTSAFASCSAVACLSFTAWSAGARSVTGYASRRIASLSALAIALSSALTRGCWTPLSSSQRRRWLKRVYRLFTCRHSSAVSGAGGAVASRALIAV
jgi:hypothetical protein